MKNSSYLLAPVFSFCLVACAAPASSEWPAPSDEAPPVEASAEEVAGHGLAAITDALANVDWQDLGDRVDEVDVENKALEVSLGRLVETDTMTVDGTLDVLALRITLAIALTDYVVVEGQTISGQVEISLAYKIKLFTQEVVVLVNTVEGDPLVFAGGTLDGNELELEDLEMTFDVGNVQQGIPTEIVGTVRVNGFAIPIDSKIIEFILGLF